jgi:CPA2 family monovalent cation:H+ antiporter-2
MRRVIRVVQDQRDARYNLLRGYFRGADDHSASELDLERLSSVTLTPGIRSIGQPLGMLTLHTVGVRVVSLRRANGKTLKTLKDAYLQDGDTLMLSGKPEALALAEEALLRA